MTPQYCFKAHVLDHFALHLDAPCISGYRQRLESLPSAWLQGLHMHESAEAL